MNRHTVIIVLFVVSIIASIKLIHPQFYTTHDGGGHVIRMEDFSAALDDGQFPVRIAKRINHGLGYPYFHFNYPLIYYSADLLHRTGFTFVEAFKVIMFSSVFLGGVLMFGYLRFYYSRFASLLGAIAYIIVPYRFLNMYVRGTLGEMVGLALYPGLFLGIEWILRSKKHTIVPLVVMGSFLLLSHNITALVAGIIAGLYALVRIHQLSYDRLFYMKKLSLAALFSLCNTVFFWYPALHDMPLTKLAELREDYQEFFPLLIEVLYSPWGFGPWKVGLYPGKMSPQIGLVHTLLFIVGVMLVGYLAMTKQKIRYRRILVYFFGITGVLFLFTLEITKPIWDAVPILQAVQHPWRFVGFIILPLSFLAAFIFSQITSPRFRWGAAALFLLLLGYANRNHIRVNQYIDHVSPFENDESVYALSTTSKDEHMPTHAPRVYTTPNQNGDVFPPEAGMSQRTTWRSNYHSFVVTMSEPGEFRDNTSYFPGWVAQIDGVDAPLLYEQDEYWRLRVPVPKGDHMVEFFFIEPLYRTIVNGISITSVSVLMIYVIWKKRIRLSSRS